MYAIPKESNYKAMKTDDAFKGNVVDIVTASYNSDFPSKGTGSHIISVIDDSENKKTFDFGKLSLSNIKVECSPLSSLLCFWMSEQTHKLDFLIMGVDDEFAHLPEVRFSFNVYYIYNYGAVGTILWLIITIYLVISIVIFTYRMFRLTFKRRTQMKKLEGIKKMMTKSFKYAPAESDYKKELDPEVPDNGTEDKISLELVANEVSS